MKKNERAIRLTIAALMVVFGLLSLSQAGYFVIRFLAIDQPLEPKAVSLFVGSAWRTYWMFFGAYLIQFPLKQIVARKGLFTAVMASFFICLTTLFMYY
ncbi:hypothetical protein MHM98_01040 [Psychrobium sp. MM17-31]|uniref:hypothetical protein n=1 Tax=Psychrobium sp. MM17-31 TaxID=2917758 RepID=UPI001EF55F89|nr:hypothetical protein [Psychrobium sp. MM17-31]MCG7529948.1 hypothetical protein [Psychrobium sp. MM17-31]